MQKKVKKDLALTSVLMERCEHARILGVHRPRLSLTSALTFQKFEVRVGKEVKGRV